MPDLGQVFTRQVVAKYMVSLFNLSSESSILEPCFGAGAFLEALNAEGFSNVTGCEVDINLYKINKSNYKLYQLFNEDFLQFGLSETFDGIIMNPPYIRQEKIDDLKEFGITKKILRKNFIYRKLPNTANLYMYFIIKAIDLLKHNGELIVIFPSSWMKARSGQKFKKLLHEICRIERIIYLNGNIFEEEALVDVVILKLIKTTDIVTTIEEHLSVQNEYIVSSIMSEEEYITVFDYPFEKLATTQRGIATGYNKMFINPEIHIKGIFLKNIISTPKNIVGYSIDEAKLDLLLDCGDQELPEEVTGYLDRFKRKILIDRKPKVLFEKIRRCEKWYKIRTISSRGIIFSYFVRNDMKFILNNSDTLVRDNFYIIRPFIDQLLMMAFLNNYYTFYQLEILGKKYGAGLLKLQRYDIEKLKFPAIDKISERDINELKKIVKELIASNNNNLLDNITKILSNYSDVNYETIRKKYRKMQKQRLEGNKDEK